MIAIGNSPNTTLEDQLLALRLVVQPWKWRESQQAAGGAVEKVEKWFREYLQVEHAIAIDSGRSAEFVILQALGIGEGDEVLVPALTCVAVPNSVIWTGAVPVYVDIDPTTFNINPKQVEKKITKKTKAIILQHTFGKPVDIDAMKKIAKRYKILLIEDGAHALGATYKGKKVGTLGDAAFFSFGRDKVVSSVSGGMMVTNNKELGEKLRVRKKTLQSPSFFFILQQLLNPIAFMVIKPLYDIGIGKFLLIGLQRLGLLTIPITRAEYTGKKPSLYPHQYSSALATLALAQLKRLDMLNKRRFAIAQAYTKALQSLPVTVPTVDEGQVMLRYSMLTDKAASLWEHLKENSIIAGRWYSNMIDPKQVNKAAVYYKEGSCPVAEVIAPVIINLPTYPTMSGNDIAKVIQTVKQFFVN